MSLEGCVLNKTWSLHLVSPLHGFDVGRIAAYSKALSKFARGVFESELSDVEIARRDRLGARATASFSVKSPESGVGLYVNIAVVLFYVPKVSENVHSDNGNVQDLKSFKTNVILCCTRDDMLDEEGALSDQEGEYEKQVQKTVMFEYALSKGKVSVLDKIHRWIEGRFDCSISEKPMPVAPRDLMGVAHYFTTEAAGGTFEVDLFNTGAGEGAAKSTDQQVADSKKAQALELTFTLPDDVSEKGLRSIQVAIPGGALEGILRALAEKNTRGGEGGGGGSSSSSSSTGGGVNEGGDANAKLQELRRMRGEQEMGPVSMHAPSEILDRSPLLDSINAFVAQQFNIRLSGARLTRVASPLLVLSSEGRVKFLNSSALSTILLHLGELCKPEINNGEQD